MLFVLFGPFIVFRHVIYIPWHGDILTAALYVAGILFVGFLFGIIYRLENKNCHKWLYRPLMSLLSTLLLSWIVFYSVFTLRKMVWSRG